MEDSMRATSESMGGVGHGHATNAEGYVWRDVGARGRIADLECMLSRARSDAEGARRRYEGGAAKLRLFSSEDMVRQVLPVMDSIERSLQDDTGAGMKEGVEQTGRQLRAMLHRNGVDVIHPQDEMFDPRQHQAVAVVEAEGADGMVVSVLQKGYRQHERVLRPAMVVVSKGKEREATDTVNPTHGLA
ncbi:nucleotide exchange factor GrpE [Candidatus Tremblayella endosymbiont of Pseudococcus viburni]